MEPESPPDHLFEQLNEPGLLTESDRRYLLGEKSYEEDQMERRAKMRMRNRIRGGLKDFWLLTHYLSDHDRQQLLADPTTQLQTPTEVFREPELRGLIQGMAFFFAMADDVNVEPEELVELGLQEMYATILSRPYVSLDVSIDVSVTQDLDELVGKIEADASLTWKDYHDLRRFLIEDWDQFVADTRHIDLADPEKLTPGDQLPLGESLIFYARSEPGDGTLLEAVENDWLHPTVIQDFSPSGADRNAS